MAEKSTALVPYEKVDNPIAFCEQMGDSYAAMTGSPQECGQAIAMTCLCENLTPIDFTRRYHLIQGKPTRRADSLLADVRTSGGDYQIVERSPERAAIILHRPNGEQYEAEFTWEEAQNSRWPWKKWEDHEKGLKDNWATPTDRRSMLWARLTMDSIRAFIPELAAGIYAPEEMQDIVVDATVNGQPAEPPRTAKEAMQELVSSVVGDDPETAPAAEDAPFDAPVEDAVFTPTEQQAPLSRVKQELLNLFEAAPVPLEEQQKALEARGAKSVAGLKEEDAQQLVDKVLARMSKN